jgi:RNA processing factor Prp31
MKATQFQNSVSLKSPGVENMQTSLKQIDSLIHQILEKTEDRQHSKASEIQSIMGFTAQYDDWISTTGTRTQTHKENSTLINYPVSRWTGRYYKILENIN